MACNALYSWTLSSIVAIYFKLVLAFILHWMASSTYFIALFLGFFGLRLPCSCNDCIRDQNPPDDNICVQRALIEWPSSMISSVIRYIFRKFPFRWNCTYESSGSFSNMNASLVESRSMNGSREPLLPAPQILHGCPCHCNSVGPQDLQMIHWGARLELRDTQTKTTATKIGFDSHAAIERKESEVNPSGLHGNGKDIVIAECDSSLLRKSVGDNLLAVELPGASDLHTKDTLNKASSSDNWYQLKRTSSLPDLDGLFNSFNTLEKELREEREARKALYMEVEKEQNAAASAAEEALAMISRIQSEKASIEMEARQFKRMVEEKSVYDEEAIEILKEIIVRQEREKSNLQDEVEMLRRSLLKDKIDKWERASYEESNEDNLSIYDVHVVQTPTKRDPEKNAVSSLPSTPDIHKRPDLLQGIAENRPLTVENDVLREGSSSGMSSGYERENLASSEQKSRNNGLDLNSSAMHDNRLERSPSYDMRTKTMILRDNARMKAEDEIECLTERLQVLLASRASAISSVEHMKKENVQADLLENIAQNLKDIHRSNQEEEHALPESFPPESCKKSFLAIFSEF